MKKKLLWLLLGVVCGGIVAFGPSVQAATVYSGGAIPDPTPVIEQPSIPPSNYRSSSLPSQFDPRKEGGDTPVKSQGNRGLCWAFSATGAIETGALKEAQAVYDFSELYLDYYFAKNALGNEQVNTHSYGRSLNAGGQEFYPIYAAINWTQPILEETMPYQPTGDIPFLTEDQLKEEPAVHVQGMVSIPKLDNEYTNEERLAKVNSIKKQVFSNSGVTYQWRSDYLGDSKFYNEGNYAFYVPQSVENQGIDHSTLIVGWDDSYAKENFSSEPNENGAFIVRNSWGDWWADNGYYYVSYEDYYVATSSIYGVSQVESKENYDNIYSHTEFYGYYPRAVYTNSAILSNVYQTNSQDETLEAVSFHTTQYNTPYEIYLSLNTDSLQTTTSLENMTHLGSGVKEIPGIETIELENGISLNGNDKFAIVVKLSKPAGVSNLYLLTENKLYDPVRYQNVVTNEGESYLALSDGTNETNLSFRDLSSVENTNLRLLEGNVYINAYTDDKETFIPVDTIEVTPTEKSMVIGEELSLSAKITPENATNKGFSWTSSDPNVATISESGVVTAKAEGTVTITAKTADGNKTATSTITVTKEIDEDDHGDTGETATKIVSNEWVQGKMNSDGDIDVFEMPIHSGRNQTIVLESPNGYVKKYTIRVGSVWYGPFTGIEAGLSDGNYRTTYTSTNSSDTAIRFFVDKSLVPAGETYKFKVRILEEGETLEPEEDDHGDTGETATKIVSNEWVQGRMNSDGDIDVFEMPIHSGRNQTIVLESPNGYVKKYTIRVGTVWFGPFTGKEAGLLDGNYRTTYTSTNSSDTAIRFFVDKSLVPVGENYKFKVRILEEGETLDPEEDDHGDTGETATKIVSNEWVQGRMNSDGDIDVFEMPIHSGRNQTIVLESPNGYVKKYTIRVGTVWFGPFTGKEAGLLDGNYRT
ncbi:lectin like domain-containing protein, partial [Enterococcus sp. HY326]|uniref:lectin like domain-containing protein n=1 Tax=Enterococcus sp. HY326 TaxID=2971265 RepID=UPI0022407BA7